MHIAALPFVRFVELHRLCVRPLWRLGLSDRDCELLNHLWVYDFPAVLHFEQEGDALCTVEVLSGSKVRLFGFICGLFRCFLPRHGVCIISLHSAAQVENEI